MEKEDNNNVQNPINPTEGLASAFESISTIINNSEITNTIPKETFESTKTTEKTKCMNEDIYENKCNINIQSEQIEEIYSEIKNRIKIGEYNSTNNTIYMTNNVVFQISKIKEQQKGENANISSIDFDECIEKIKGKYIINDEDDLIIFKTDIHSENSTAIFVQYEIYNPYTLEPIPLDICEDATININIPIVLTPSTESLYLSLNYSGYNLFDSNDSFYKDICKTYTTENGTDISLLDRKSIIYDNNKDVFLCQEGCTFSYYNETTKKSICNCKAQRKPTITNLKDISFDKKAFVDDFVMSSLKNSNFRVVKCIKLILSRTGQLNNYGSYMLIGTTAILVACMFSYLFKGNKIINDFIQIVIKQKFYSDKSENSNNQYKTRINKIKSLKKKEKKNHNNKKSSKSVDGKNNKQKKKEINYPPKKKKQIKQGKKEKLI